MRQTSEQKQPYDAYGDAERTQKMIKEETLNK